MYCDESAVETADRPGQRRVRYRHGRSFHQCGQHRLHLSATTTNTGAALQPTKVSSAAASGRMHRNRLPVVTTQSSPAYRGPRHPVPDRGRGHRVAARLCRDSLQEATRPFPWDPQEVAVSIRCALETAEAATVSGRHLQLLSRVGAMVRSRRRDRAAGRRNERQGRELSPRGR